MTITSVAPAVDVSELEVKVREMYREVAEHPDGSFHFELGRDLAERLGYPPMIVDEIPAAAVESFAGVGSSSTSPSSTPASPSSTSAPGRGWTCSSRRWRWARRGT